MKMQEVKTCYFNAINSVNVPKMIWYRDGLGCYHKLVGIRYVYIVMDFTNMINPNLMRSAILRCGLTIEAHPHASWRCVDEC